MSRAPATPHFSPIARGRRVAPVFALAIALALALTPCAGCQGRSRTLSPTSLEDPERAIHAARETAEVERANRAAEARFFRLARSRAAAPEPNVHPDPPNDDVTIASH